MQQDSGMISICCSWLDIAVVSYVGLIFGGRIRIVFGV